MNIRLFAWMGLSLLIVLPIVAYIVTSIDRKDKIKYNTGASLYVQNSKFNPMYYLYQRLRQNWLTRDYIGKIARRYEILCPAEPKVIAQKTMRVSITVVVFCFVEVFLVYLLRPSLHNGVLATILIFIIHNEVINWHLKTTEIKLLEDMSFFISNVRHNYYVNRLVDDAIFHSMDEVGTEMKVHAKKLYEIITTTNLKEDVIRYNSTTHNKYLKMFLSLCINILEYDDKKVNGQLLFTSNLDHLKREINIEILKQKKLKYIFSGTVFVTIAVCLPIDAIQKFGISLVPELIDFYTGRGGTLFVGAIFLTSVLVYLLVNNLKDIKQLAPKSYPYLEKLQKIRIIRLAINNYYDKNYGKMLILKDTLKRVGETIAPKQLMLKRILAAVVTFFLCLILSFYLHFNNRLNLTERVSNLESFASIANKAQTDIIKDTILSYVKEYREKSVSEEMIQKELSEQRGFYNAKLKEQLTTEINRRINGYQKEYFHWYELIICLVASGLAYAAPYWFIFYKKKLLNMIMEDEVNQFNSIIYMLMYIEHMTVKDLLEQMELFAVVFKPSIRECINDYNSGDIEALIRLKERESYRPFQRLVDNLIRCDMIPMEKAFDEVASEREYYHDRRKQENEISIQKRADIAKPLSFVPAVLVTIYLLLPLLVASLKELESFQESLSSMGF